MALEYFPFYHSYFKKCEKLTDQELGRLVRSLMQYSITGERQELAGRESIAFDFIADDIDRAKEAYNGRCAINKANIDKRYTRPADMAAAENSVQTYTVEYDGIQDATNEYDRIRTNTTVYDGIRSNTIEYDGIRTPTNAYESYQSKSKSKSKSKSNTLPDGRDKSARFTPPTLAEVEAYNAERGGKVDAKKFWEYYNAGDWKDGKGEKVRSWKQKLITWESKEQTSKPPKGSALEYEQKQQSPATKAAYAAEVEAFQRFAAAQAKKGAAE